ncbi:MAG: hypothetical protein IJT12_00510 [Paludibacteraceae bacterium]|nr:hypothetical protein [Paludibacteraceae bacterium]
MKQKQIFDFSRVGKRTPYHVPESFFDKSRKKLVRKSRALSKAQSQTASAPQSQTAPARPLRPWVRYAGIAAGVLVLFSVAGLWHFARHESPVEAVYTSEGDLYDYSWEEFAEADIFLDEMDW